MNFVVDTGSPTTFLPKKRLRMLPDIKLQATRTTIKSMSGAIHPVLTTTDSRDTPRSKVLSIDGLRLLQVQI